MSGHRAFLDAIAKARRAYTAAVLADFEVTESPKDTLRRMVVVNAVAKRLGVKVVNSTFIGFVNRVVASLGAEHTRPGNARMWRKLRRRAA